MTPHTDGSLTTWSDAGGVRIAAADANCVAWFLDIREDPDDWRCFGSVHQPNQIFVATYWSVLAATLAALAIRGERWLQDGIAWEDIGRDGRALFTNDSGNMMLTLS